MTDSKYTCSRCNLSFTTGQELGGHKTWKCRYPATLKRKVVEEEEVENEVEEEENNFFIEENLNMEEEVKYACMQ